MKPKYGASKIGVASKKDGVPNGSLTKPISAQKKHIRKKSMSKEVRSVMSNSKNVSAKYKNSDAYPYHGQGTA
jgi:hypothetical protein